MFPIDHLYNSPLRQAMTDDKHDHTGLNKLLNMQSTKMYFIRKYNILVYVLATDLMLA